MPSQRWDGQLYVFGAMESPLHLRSQVTTAKSVWRFAFNLTATYKRDADILWPYGSLRYEPSPISNRPNYKVIAVSKRKTAVWLVSNCKTQSKREHYVKEMKKYVDIDIYGRCGRPTNCSRAEYGPCMVQLLSQYKFYIAFENSICDDYMSEKLFKLFVPNNHIIPVVRGGADVDTLLPNNTFVNADWFKTAKDLALFLKSLSTDMDAYSRYLQAKDVYTSETREKILCTLCETLTSSVLRPRVYDLKTWLDGQCRAPRAFT
ncbi:unnamed protein product [Lymnaea stagnalis]|uniref:Fucosyltransferase n=1 Tax=Lymnaea stagnalis TaxID=6523 RepID=A0AAV2H956_LYMST